MVQKHCKNYDCCPSLHPICSQKCSDSRKISGFGFLWSVRSPLPMWCVRPQVNSLQLAPGLPWSTLKRGPFHCSFSLLLFSLPKNCHFASLSLFSGSKFLFDSICFRKITQQMTYTGNFFVVLLVITPALSIFFGKVVTFNISYISYSHILYSNPRHPVAIPGLSL